MPCASLPLVIQDSLSRIPAFLASVAVAFGRSGERQRGMRSDRRGSIGKVVSVMLRGAALQFDGLICHFEKFWARPKSVPEIARLAGVSTATVGRCLADLTDLGLLESRQIKRKNPQTGQLEVSIALRNFTPKFWEGLGLWEKIQEGIKWAKEHAKRKFILPFKGVSVKAKSTVQKAGNLLKNVLGDLRAKADLTRDNFAKQKAEVDSSTQNSGQNKVKMHAEAIKARLKAKFG